MPPGSLHRALRLGRMWGGALARLLAQSSLKASSPPVGSKLRGLHTSGRLGDAFKDVRACRLSSRGVLRLAGRDTPGFLQGLVTNDIHSLMEGGPGMQYALMLNVQGRVLYDMILCNITKEPENPTLLVDVDVDIKEDLIKILRRYKIRKKVDISDVSDSLNVWCHFLPGGAIPSLDSSDALTALDTQPHNGETHMYADPRVPGLAHRIITSHTSTKLEEATPPQYRDHRYKWGIPEGTVDLPPGQCLPLESNVALMNGVNFNKGCYIGQELTARTYHTGVTRKRLLPLVLERNADIAPGSPISTSSGKNAGKFRNKEGSVGLGLIRLARLQDSLSLQCVHGNTVQLTCQVPEWWPSNALNPDPTS